jgi:hypothetical protein
MNNKYANFAKISGACKHFAQELLNDTSTIFPRENSYYQPEGALLITQNEAIPSQRPIPMIHQHQPKNHIKRTVPIFLGTLAPHE